MMAKKFDHKFIYLLQTDTKLLRKSYIMFAKG